MDRTWMSAHVNVLELKAAFVDIRTYCHHRSYKYIRVILIKVILSRKNTMKSQKKYGHGVIKIMLSFLLQKYQENTVLKQTNFLGNLTII